MHQHKTHDPCEFCGCCIPHVCWRKTASESAARTHERNMQTARSGLERNPSDFWIDDSSVSPREGTDNLSEKGGTMAKKRKKVGC